MCVCVYYCCGTIITIFIHDNNYIKNEVLNNVYKNFISQDSQFRNGTDISLKPNAGNVMHDTHGYRGIQII